MPSQLGKSLVVPDSQAHFGVNDAWQSYIYSRAVVVGDRFELHSCDAGRAAFPNAHQPHGIEAVGSYGIPFC
jgi:hypothetical protein